MKESAHIVDEQVGGRLGGKVIASVIDIPGDDVLMPTLSEGSDGTMIIGKIGQTKRGHSWLGWIILRMRLLIVQTSRRGCGIGEPIERCGRQNVVVTETISVAPIVPLILIVPIDLVVPGELAPPAARADHNPCLA